MWIVYMSEGIDYPCDQAYEPFFDTFQDSVIRLSPCIERCYVHTSSWALTTYSLTQSAVFFAESTVSMLNTNILIERYRL